MNYLSLNQLLLKIRSGKGLSVIIEGVHNGDDEWVYSQWFGNLAHLITFYPQDGYSKVIDAVETLRIEREQRHVAGIIDRDFSTQLIVRSQYEPNYTTHIYRTDRYTLENYLLEPEGWYEIALLFWRNKLPKGWRSVEECRESINNIFKDYLPAAAYNWLVWDLGQKYGPAVQLEYKDSPHLEPETLYQNMLIFCRSQGLPDPDEYFLRLELLSTKPELWQQKVSGKMIFNHLLKTFPVPRTRPDKHIFINYYVSRTEAPKELNRLVQFLITKYLGETVLTKSAV